MEMVEIDPKLFVTCRLCLDNLGVYQIVPSVQQQIKFCYDIEVDPFDGLPQLICKNCEFTLSKYAEIKTTYVDKQKTLRDQLEGKIVKTLRAEAQTEQETVSSTQQLASEGKDNKRSDSNFYSTASDTDTSIKLKLNRKKTFRRIKKSPPDVWKSNYDIWFICRFCKRPCKTRTGMRKHLNTHPNLLSKYQTYIKSHCYVKLNKIDGKSNICDSERIVVHGSDKFVNSEDIFYYSLFTPKKRVDNNDRNSILGSLDLENKFTSSESTDSEPILKRPRKKRQRLLSRSSNETVLLEKNNIKDKLDFKSTTETTTIPRSKAVEIIDSECINIDDSSDSASFKSSNTSKIEISTDLLLPLRDTDSKTIQNIITVCYKKYLKRQESCENEIPCHILQKSADKIDSSLKHKVLSFGRKVINYPGINCIGLLRYLEHQNLEIIWIQRFIKKFEYVRIMTKLRNRDENNSQDFGWDILYNYDQADDCSKPDDINLIDEQVATKNLTPVNNTAVNNITETDKISNLDSLDNTFAEVLTDQAILSPDNTATEKDILLKKLLNANPVPNPKQLPKKINIIPKKFNVKKLNINKKQSTKKKKNDSKNHGEKSSSENADNDSVLPMPVITSTVSLAPVTSDIMELQNCNTGNVDLEFQNVSSSSMPEECGNTRSTESESNIITEIPEAQQGSVKNVPWIKVKPASELMSDIALNSIQQQQSQQINMAINQCQKINVPFQNMANVVFMTKVAVPQSNIPGCQEPQNQSTQNTFVTTGSEESMSTSLQNSDREYVLMDSVDLPYTRTDSPFRYFKNLLHIHNIILLDANEAMSVDFVCLLKFKLVFQQVSNLPVVLCLALFYSKRQFCLKVKDVNQKDIDISRLSANWQWEILKVYTGDVVPKLLQNAQKISQEVHDCTQLFLCLLKSIKFEKPA